MSANPAPLFLEQIERLIRLLSSIATVIIIIAIITIAFINRYRLTSLSFQIKCWLFY